MKHKSYSWKGKTATGNKQKGTITAASKNIAINKLKSLGITTIITIKINLFSFVCVSRQKLNRNESHCFFSTLYELYKSGLALADCLALIERSADNSKIRLFSHELNRAIKSGQSLSGAINASSYSIVNSHIEIIKIGETSGNLEQVLHSICLILKKNISLRKKLLSALIYPACVIFITIIVLSILFVFIIPQFQIIYSNSNATLPMFTQLLLIISNHFLSMASTFLLLILLICFSIYYLSKKYYRIQTIIQSVVLKLPLIKSIIMISQQAKIAFALQITLSSGITLESALEQCINSTEIVKLKKYLTNITTLVKSGRGLSNSLELNPLFTNAALHQVRMAENTGQLDYCFNQINHQLTDQLDQIIENLSQLIEPFIIIFLGGMIGLIIIAMYLPIFQLGSVF